MEQSKFCLQKFYQMDFSFQFIFLGSVMQKKWYHLVSLGFLFLFVGCASYEKTQSAPASAELAMSERGLTTELEEGAGSSSSKPASATRLLIKKASIELVVDDVEQVSQSIIQLANRLGGYVDSSNTREEKRAWLEIRIPSEQLEKTLEELSILGEEQNRTLNATDVTDQVIDLEAKLTNDRALRDRLRKLLDQAKDVKDILSIETELNRIQTELDSLEGQLKRLRSEIQLSSVTITLERGTIYGPFGYMYLGVVWFLEKLFVLRS